MKKYRVLTDNLEWCGFDKGCILENKTGVGWKMDNDKSGLIDCSHINKLLHKGWIEGIKDNEFIVKTADEIQAGSDAHIIRVEEINRTPDEIIIPMAYLSAHIEKDVPLKVVRNGLQLITEGFFIATTIPAGTYLKTRKINREQFTKEDMIEFGKATRFPHTCGFSSTTPEKIFDEWLKSKEDENKDSEEV